MLYSDLSNFLHSCTVVGLLFILRSKKKDTAMINNCHKVDQRFKKLKIQNNKKNAQTIPVEKKIIKSYDHASVKCTGHWINRKTR